jgi:hypothetical protein
MGSYINMFLRILNSMKKKIKKSKDWLNKSNEPKYLSGKEKPK